MQLGRKVRARRQGGPCAVAGPRNDFSHTHKLKPASWPHPRRQGFLPAPSHSSVTPSCLCSSSVSTTLSPFSSGTALTSFLSLRGCAVRSKPHHPQHGEHREADTTVGSHGPVSLNQECRRSISRGFPDEKQNYRADGGAK